MDEPKVALLELSESFSDVWETLAMSAFARIVRIGSGDLLDADPGTCAVVISCGGAEPAAVDVTGDVCVSAPFPVAVVGSARDHRLAVSAVRAGASEYFALPGDLEAVRTWMVERADALRADRQAAALAASARRQYDFSQLLGESTELKQAIDRAARIIPRADTTVLVTGETGTGKELLAQAIHYNGPRAAAPFVEVNCAALPPTLLESELFGYEKGAFTDARAARPGLFEAAHGGTLFLDEIGDLQADLQVKLLKVLEDRKVRRLGSVRTIQVDLRIIAATSVDLPAAVEAGTFREDLYYRLSVLPIELPALRHRGDDVLLLARHFTQAFGERFGIPGVRLTDTVERTIASHDWPGNVRELRNAIERAVLLGDGAIRVDDLFVGRVAPRTVATEGPLPFPAALDQIEQAAARAMVERHQGNKSAAADALGISRSRLYRLLEG